MCSPNLFLPCVTFVLLQLQTILPHLKLLIVLFFKNIQKEKYATDNRVENKMEEYFPIYSNLFLQIGDS